MIDPDLARLLSRCGASVTTDPAALAESVAGDFGGVERRLPLACADAGDARAIAGVFNAAGDAGLPITIRGAGHSCHGQTLSEGGVILRVFGAQGSIEWLPDGRMMVPAAASWMQVEQAANARGRAIPVLPDYLGLSVGGTLSVGGYGVRSIVHGAQVDQVSRLHLVLPDGTGRWCSPEEDTDLFRFALAGGGGLGAIERVVLQTVPLRRRLRLVAIRHASLAGLAESLRAMQSGERAIPDAFLGAWLRSGSSTGTIISEYGFDVESPDEALPRAALPAAPPFASQVILDYPLWSHARRTALIDALPRHRRLWADWVLPAASLGAFAAFLDEHLRDPEFSSTLRVIYLLAIGRPTGKVDFPFEAASGLAADRLRFGVGLYHFAPAADASALATATASLREAGEAALALGARPYLYGRHALSVETRRRLYGPALDSLRELRARFHSASLLSHPLL